MAATESNLDRIKRVLTRSIPSATVFAETVYRSSTPQYAKESDLLSGEGSKRNGGRWNPIGVAVVYASLTPETAMAETLAHNRYYGIPIEDAMPRTFVAIKVSLHAVLDFRQGSVRQRLQISLERIVTLDWRREILASREPITQTIGRAAAEVGLEGLIVPSSVDWHGHNLLLFPRNLRADSEVRLLNPERLMP
jgi:RES domain-containing protein